MSGPRFLTPLLYEPLSNGRWILTDHLIFYSERYRGRFVAPAGFEHDFASIPKFLHPLFPKRGKHDRAAVIHDGAYGNVLITEHGERIFCAKFVGDNLFEEGMRADKVNGVRLRIMHRAVTLFGDPLGHPLAAHRPR